ncbi:MAG: hypothetical protein ACJARP_002472 [Vicingaceae bacterium]|jgi:hypothetical protein
MIENSSKLFVKSLFCLLISVLFLCACGSEHNKYHAKVVEYIRENLGIQFQDKSEQYVLVLNPYNNCVGCHYKAYQKIKEIQNEEKVFVITDELTSRSIGGAESDYFVIDYEKELFDINADYPIQNKFYVIQNNQIINQVTITPTNIDTIDTFVHPSP